MASGVLIGRVKCSGVLWIECGCFGAFCEDVLFFTFSISPSGITVVTLALILPVEVLSVDGGVSSWSLSIPGMLVGCGRWLGASVEMLSEDGGVSSLGLSSLGMLVRRRRRSGTSSSRAETGRINASSSSEMFEVMVSTNPS